MSTVTTSTRRSRKSEPAAETAGNDPAAENGMPYDEAVRTLIQLPALQPAADIHARLRAVRHDIGHIGKEKRNTGIGGGYQFRGVDDALNHVGPVFVRYGVTVEVETSDLTVRREVIELENGKERTETHATVRMSVRFSCPSGHVCQTTYGEGLDFGSDKAINKAMSGAFKYALFLGLCLPVEPETLTDSDHDHQEPERNRTRSISGDASKRRSGRPAESGGGMKPMGVCPECGAAAVIQGKPEYGGGWLCWKAKGGCGAKFAEDPAAVGEGSQETPDAEPAGTSGGSKAAFWKYCKSLEPPVYQEDAARIWETYHSAKPGRLRLEAWCVSRGVTREAVDAAWAEYQDERLARESLERSLDAAAAF